MTTVVFVCRYIYRIIDVTVAGNVSSSLHWQSQVELMDFLNFTRSLIEVNSTTVIPTVGEKIYFLTSYTNKLLLYPDATNW